MKNTGSMTRCIGICRRPMVRSAGCAITTIACRSTSTTAGSLTFWTPYSGKNSACWCVAKYCVTFARLRHLNRINSWHRACAPSVLRPAGSAGHSAAARQPCQKRDKSILRLPAGQANAVSWSMGPPPRYKHSTPGFRGDFAGQYRRPAKCPTQVPRTVLPHPLRHLADDEQYKLPSPSAGTGSHYQNGLSSSSFRLMTTAGRVQSVAMKARSVAPGVSRLTDTWRTPITPRN